jgi:hypothetical protein
MSSPSGAAALKQVVEAAPELKPEAPRPLVRELPPADLFPIDELGAVLAPAARAIHDVVQAPLAICGQSVLAAATLAVQAHGDVTLPIGEGQAKPLSCYFLTVAASGERKSAADAEALRAVRSYESILRERRDVALPAFVNDKMAWEKARDAATKKAKGDRAAIKAALEALGPAPPPPLEPIVTAPEPTFEGLCRLFAVGQPSLGLFATEGGQFIGGHGMSDEAKLRTATGLSNIWDGEPIRRVRAGDGAMILPGRRLAAHLMVQPEVAALLLNDRLLSGQGLLSRFLVTAPESAAGTRLWHDPSANSSTALNRYRMRLTDILEAPLPLAGDRLNELNPRPLPLSSEARRLWVAFTDHIERNIAPGRSLEPIRGLANKIPEHAARIAGVLTLIDDFAAAGIDAKHMQPGIVLAQHYAAEALRLFGASQIGTDLRLAQGALHWLQTAWTEQSVSLPDLYQRGPNAIRDKGTADKAVRILEDHGWLVRIHEGAVINGNRRRDAWRIVGR